VKIFYKGAYYYSNGITLKTPAMTAPVITFRDMVLTSSASSGNQWFLNNVLIAGATASTYTPTQAGLYTVQQTVGGCVSPMSAAFNYTITAIPDPAFSESVRVFPNPASGRLYIQNMKLRKLQLSFFNATGVKVKEMVTTKRNDQLNIQSLPAGTYFIYITELHTSKTIRRAVLKL
jgi:hypothetical protein